MSSSARAEDAATASVAAPIKVEAPSSHIFFEGDEPTPSINEKSSLFGNIEMDENETEQVEFAIDYGSVVEKKREITPDSVVATEHVIEKSPKTTEEEIIMSEIGGKRTRLSKTRQKFKKQKTETTPCETSVFDPYAQIIVDEKLKKKDNRIKTSRSGSKQMAFTSSNK